MTGQSNLRNSGSANRKRSRTFDNCKIKNPYDVYPTYPDNGQLVTSKNSFINESSNRPVSKNQTKRTRDKRIKSSNLSSYQIANSRYREQGLFSHLLSKEPFDLKNSVNSRLQTAKSNYAYSKTNILSKRDTSMRKDTRTGSKADISVRRMKSSKLSKSAQKKKKGRVEALFKKENLGLVDIEAVVDNWTIIVKTFEGLKTISMAIRPI